MIEWFSNVWTIVLVAIGIGGVIFVHECGHFFMARWCGVRVECFSLGFGPRLVGWKRGTTTYQLALLPLGGYVKMAGEEGSASGVAGPDELPSKSVGQRFLIYSGGVLANVLLGLVVFPILFAHGVPFSEPLLGASAPGSPAWQAGIEPGTRVLSVNDRKVVKFGDIATEIALGSPERADLELVTPSGERRSMTLTPRYDEGLGAFSIGVSPGADPSGRISVDPKSAAAQAGLRAGDRLLEVEGGLPGIPLSEQLSMAVGTNLPVRVAYERDGKRAETEVAPVESAKATVKLLGVFPVYDRVAALRESPRVVELGLAKDDRLIAVDGKPLLREYDLHRALAAAGTTVRFEIERAGARRTAELRDLAPEQRARLAQDVGLAPDESGTRVAVMKGSPAERAGLRDGDRIVKLDGAETNVYADVKNAVERKRKHSGEPLAIVAERRDEGGARFLELTTDLPEWHLREYGFALQSAQYVYSVSGPIAAVQEGWLASWRFIQEGWLTLKRILRREVSSDNIGGIITIAVVSHSFAESGVVSLLFFLCMLSMNLAFLNVLPIPVLDGGHLLFLLIEKIKGSPVSERILGYSQMVGIVLILSLMVYVTFKDVMRWIVN